MTRAQKFGKIKAITTQWDVVIIGGGASGLGCAIDAASRGYRTLLVEKYDFAKGTSSRSTKLVHGGVRYLAQGDISMVLEALKERGLLMKNAPHLVKNQSFVIPVYDWWGGPFYTVGLKVYDKMAGKFGLGPSENLSKAKTIKAIPNVLQKGLNGGVVYHDGQFDDARLAVSLALTAQELGATVINYCGVDSILKEKDGTIKGVSIKDIESGNNYNIKAKVVINATGVWADDILQMDDAEAKKTIKPSQGVHLVLDRSFLKGDSAIMIPRTDDGRVLFLVPWHDVVIVGTTDTPVKKVKLEPTASEQEIEFILQNANKYLTKKPKRKDVLSVFAGLRPLYIKPDSKSTKTKNISRGHQIIVSDSGLVSLVGGKWTTYRKMGEDAIEKAILVGGLRDIDSQTRTLPIYGYTKKEQKGQFSIYGSYAKEVSALCKDVEDGEKQVHKDFDFTVGEVIWAIRNEMARTVEDILSRRQRALLFNAKKAIEAAPKVAAVMAQELGKDVNWIEDQIKEFNAIAKNYILE